MRTIVLVACASSKQARAAQAKELYTSSLFRKAYAYAESLKPDAIYILSAKHGLVKPEQVLEPYNTTLNKMPKAKREEWAGRVLEQLRGCCDLEHDRFVFLAGSNYRAGIIPHLKHYETPLQGLGIGKQLAWLGEHA